MTQDKRRSARSRTDFGHDRTYDERAIMRAWEAFVADGRPQATGSSGIRSLIQDSWARCVGRAIDARGREAPLHGSDEELDRLRRANRELRAAATGSFARIGKLLEASEAMLILTDREGVILETVGDPRTLEEARKIHLEVGGVWNEGVVGTNGIGTALWTGEPVFVHAAEHFCAGIKPWSCAGVPIRDPVDGSVIGVVDLSGLIDVYRPHNTALVAFAALEIEGALARSRSEERVRLLEAFIDTAPSTAEREGLVIVDRLGRVVYSRHAPERASVDGVERDVAPGLRLLRLADEMGVADIGAALPDGLNPRDISPLKIDGELLGAALILPSQQAALRSAAATARAGRPRGGASLIVGESRELLEAIDLACGVARSDASVLIEGETGVGKELFARLLHAEAGRSLSSPFIAVNCGAIARELFGAELFGHVAGAFTGAAREGRPGKLELAHGGVLCLDEVGELPLDLQPYLLRVLEEKAVYRIGDHKRRPVDIRIVALTNRDLKAEVEAGRFRRDLYYRIGAVTIRVPPLRERGRDVELLLDHFNRTVAAETRQAPLRFADPVRRALLAYAWPGNVRELRNLIVRLHLLVRDREVGLGHLPEELTAGRPPTPAGPAPAAGRLDELERDAIRRTIAAEDANMTRVARRLGISRPTLYRKLRLYGIERQGRY